MQDPVEELAARGLVLAPSDRARLAERLLDSLKEAPSQAVDDAWNREIERRVAAFRRGEVPAFSAEEVFAEAQRRAR